VKLNINLICIFVIGCLTYVAGIEIGPVTLDVAVKEDLLKGTSEFSVLEKLEIAEIRAGAEVQIVRRGYNGEEYILRQTYYNKKLNKYVDEYYTYSVSASGKEIGVSVIKYQIRTSSVSMEEVSKGAVEPFDISESTGIPAGPGGFTHLSTIILTALVAVVGFVIALLKRRTNNKGKGIV